MGEGRTVMDEHHLLLAGIAPEQFQQRVLLGAGSYGVVAFREAAPARIPRVTASESLDRRRTRPG